ncbi:MAG TPA: hypothetical protein VMV94_00265 [Phycisphaerae bacterium]|nr:hypothetical protein [Phycisphaerae bacterium]
MPHFDLYCKERLLPCAVTTPVGMNTNQTRDLRLSEELNRMNDVAKRTCQGCNAEITAEQIAQRQAGLVQGVLLCPNCVAEKRRAAMQQAAAAKKAAPAANPAPRATAAPVDEADIAISLIDDDEMPTSQSREIRSFAKGSTLGGKHHDDKLTRPLGGPRDAASRIRTFHSKLTDAGLANMDDTINEWLDSHPEIFIKTVTSSIGIFESKTKEPHLFVCVFY